jgi:hypothetical protein
MGNCIWCTAAKHRAFLHPCAVCLGTASSCSLCYKFCCQFARSDQSNKREVTVFLDTWLSPKLLQTACWCTCLRLKAMSKLRMSCVSGQRLRGGLCMQLRTR